MREVIRNCSAPLSCNPECPCTPSTPAVSLHRGPVMDVQVPARLCVRLGRVACSGCEWTLVASVSLSDEARGCCQTRNSCQTVSCGSEGWVCQDLCRTCRLTISRCGDSGYATERVRDEWHESSQRCHACFQVSKVCIVPRQCLVTSHIHA